MTTSLSALYLRRPPSLPLYLTQPTNPLFFFPFDPSPSCLRMVVPPLRWPTYPPPPLRMPAVRWTS